MREVLARGRRLIVVAACVVWCAGAVGLQAQSTTGVNGSVLDPDGKAVVNAAVVIRNDGTGFVRATATDAGGRFSFTAMPAGVYVVEVSAPGFAMARRSALRVVAGQLRDITVTLAIAPVSEQVTVSEALPPVAQGAPSQGSLTARSAQSIISSQYIQNYTSPIADYSQVVQMAPGTFSVSPNGVGLGDTKTYFRGFSDGSYTMTFDGIPFNDTNDPTHHSWAFFPSQFTGGAVFDRSPGSASTIGPANFGGSINLESRDLPSRQAIKGTIWYGSFNTRLFDAEYDSGQVGAGGKSRLLLEAHDMRSDGYQTYNFQKRQAVSGKYRYALSDRTALTAYGSFIDFHSNTPDQKGSTRAQIAQYGDDFLMTADPSSPLYYGYNFYHIPSDFEYVGLESNLGHGWSMDDKVYTYRYWNQQNYNSTTKLNSTSGVDKLNGYRKCRKPPADHAGVDARRSQDGPVVGYAVSDRHQTPSDPHTWIDAAIPNFHETFNTTTLQPYVEYQFTVTPALRITPGLKYDYYRQDFVQYADNGGKIGDLNGASSIAHAAAYHTWLPSFDVHYLARNNWSVYAQYTTGDTIPPTSVFDVKDAQVGTLPAPTRTKSYQAGSVWKGSRATLDVDAYYVHFDNDYSSFFDQSLGYTVYFANGAANTKGVEAESNILIGNGLSLYVNGTAGHATYADTGLTLPTAPQDTEAVGLSYNRSAWNVGWFSKRIGKMYNDNGSKHEAITIDPFSTTNLFVNYRLRNASRLSQSRIRLSVNNLFDDHSIVGVKPASKNSSAPAAGDLLTLVGGRSVSLTFTVGFSPSNP